MKRGSSLVCHRLNFIWFGVIDWFTRMKLHKPVMKWDFWALTRIYPPFVHGHTTTNFKIMLSTYWWSCLFMQKWRFADTFSFLSPSAHLQHLPFISFLSEKNDRHHHRSHGSFQNARLPIAETTTSFLLFGIVHMALFALLVSYDCLILFAQVFYEATKTDW